MDVNIARELQRRISRIAYEGLKANFEPRYAGDTPNAQWLAWRYVVAYGDVAYRNLEMAAAVALRAGGLGESRAAA